MEQRIEKMVKSTKAPLNENVAWVDTTDRKSKIKIHNNGEWQEIGGDGSGLNPNVEIGNEYGTNTVNIANKLVTLNDQETGTEITLPSYMKINFEKDRGQLYAAVDAGFDSGDDHQPLLSIAAVNKNFYGEDTLCPSVEIQTFPYGMPIKITGMCIIDGAEIQDSTIKVGSGNTYANVYHSSISNASIGPVPNGMYGFGNEIKIGDKSNTGGISIGGSDVGQLTTEKIIIKYGVNLLDNVQITDTMIKLADDSNSNPESRYIQFNDDSIVFYNNGKTATLTLS